MAADRRLISYRDAAALAGLSESTLRRLDRAGAMPGVVIHITGARAYVRRAALLAWLDSEQALEPTPEPLRALGGSR